MFKYSDFRNVDEFKKYYGLDKVNESKINEVQKENKITNNSANEPAKVIKDDKLEVVYADQKPKEYHNIFKHIIVFTNDKNEKNNKTLKNIYDAVDELKKVKCDIIPEIHVFVAAEIDADEREEEIKITDGDDIYPITYKITRIERDDLSKLTNGQFWYKYNTALENPILFEKAAVIETQLTSFWQQAYTSSLYCEYFIPEY